MAINSKLDTYWDEFVDNFISTLLADGYDEFEILDKIMTVFKEVRKKRFMEENNNKLAIERGFYHPPISDDSKEVKEIAKSQNQPFLGAGVVQVPGLSFHAQELNADDLVETIAQAKPRAIPAHRKPISRKKNPCNYDKTLHSKFPHAVVYIKGAKEESLATIEVGDSQKSRDCYKLVSNGMRYSEVDYLKTFNHNLNDTPGGFSYLNRHVIVFDVNPTISVGYVKHLKHYNNFKNIDDIKNWKKSHGGRGVKKNDI